MGVDRYKLTERPRRKMTPKDVRLKAPEKYEPGAWFLGPNGENLASLQKLVDEVLTAHAKARKDFWPDDPDFISKQVQDGAPFKKTMGAMSANLAEINRALRSSTPMSSYRNKSHMNWDITVPGITGYLAGMLFNANNVATEASPVTTMFELEVGLELCEMLGFDLKSDPPPWGHITCDGSIANTEAMWAARNLRYQGAALARAVMLEPALSRARGLSVRTARGDMQQLLDLEPWDLVNLPNEVILSLPKMIEDCGIDAEAVKDALDAYSIQALGIVDFHTDVLMGLKTGCVICPATAHYSWDKGVTILGLGQRAIRHYAVDLDARGSIAALREALEECVEAQRPVIQTVAVIGSTTESAVDPLAQILDLRREFQSRGLNFALHADAAWGGYFASILRAPKGRKTITPVLRLSPYVTGQMNVLDQVDTITVDPHKSGYIPYPAGSLCYRDNRMPYLISYTAPVVYHDTDVPSAGVYGIEGSKPGAAAVAVKLSHVTIPPDSSGYGFLLGRCIFNSKRLYVGIKTLADDHDPFFATSVQRSPAECDGSVEAINEEYKQMKLLKKMSNETLQVEMDNDTEQGRLFRSLGPDMTVFAYAFNFLTEDGEANDDLDRMNKMNELIFHKLSIEEVTHKDEPPKVPMIVTSSLLSKDVYGEAFYNDFCKRAKVTPTDAPLRVLISTMQDPWVTDTSQGDFLDNTLLPIFRGVVLDIQENMVSTKR